MNLTDSDIKSVYDDIYCSMFEKVIQEQMLINYSQKVIAKESKLSVRSVTPYTKTQINFLNGNQFYGDINECRMTGNGRYLWANDDSIYEGEFSRPNVIEGRGTLKFRDASTSSSSSLSSTGFSRYCGNFVNGMYHGKGQLINYFFKYNGNFECDKFHGKGKLECGIESFDGCFKNGKRVSGKRIYINGIFMGDYDENEMRKYGKYNFNNGDCYCGAFKNGLFDGYGRYIWASSSNYESVSYCGEWKEHYRHGLGMLNLLNGTRCTTIFIRGEKNGSGIVWAANNKFYLSKVMFANDEFIDCKQISINQENIALIRSLFDTNELQKLSSTEFDAIIMLLEDKYSTITELNKNNNGDGIKLLTYPFHLNWFDLHVEEHDAIWEFVKKFPNTNKQQEFTSIVQFIREHANTFREFYRKYAEYSNKVLFEQQEINNNVMKRIGLWQFFRDLRLYEKSSLYNIQQMIEDAENEFNILTFDT
ncbi:hypothetical protein PVAND_000552 [Polypedilum vanderplanki]|uniref:MORN repeat protein n=1 Tax=Polypedilum vanderplanki TaxID=319348 RepID=A0A9J6BLA8_POLVA|nr:hypothetical protein PVAND_000552 [Polypedilum vanderplanki]